MATVELKKLQKINGPVARAFRAMKPWTTFFRQFLKHPAMIGSIIPSSGALVKSVLADVEWSETRVFVEYGPGVGTFTRHILAKLPAHAVLIAIDTNADFVRYLNADIADHRFRAVAGSAADVRQILFDLGYSEADYVLSGLPFSTLPPGVGAVIVDETHATLKEGGAFLVYQYSNFVLRLLQSHFPVVEQELEWLNIPPCRIFRSQKVGLVAQAA